MNIEKLFIFENIKSNELILVFSNIVFKRRCCDKVWGDFDFSLLLAYPWYLQKVARNNIDRAKTDGSRGRI